jgi:hypothetical protein
MTTEELRTNGYAIKFDKDNDIADRMLVVLKELCPDDAETDLYRYVFFWYNGTDRWNAKRTTDRPTIPLSEVQLMSEVLTLPRMVEVRDHDGDIWKPFKLYGIGANSMNCPYVGLLKSKTHWAAYKFMRELDPNKETNESIARLEAEIKTLKSTLK